MARIEVEPKIQEIWYTNQTKGLRALQYSELLPPDTEVKPAFSISGDPQKLSCQNSCWLFFVDKAPGAHFAHPVSIILLDAVTGEQQIMETEWWPEVSGPNTDRKQLFGTREMRMSPDMTVFEKLPVTIPGIQLQNAVPPLPPQGPYLSEISVNGMLCDGCFAWAIIVCGFDDRPDTFDEDTNGIYDVLKTLGLSDDHIFYLSPHSDPGVDAEASRDNVQWAIQEVANQACENDKVLFFYSSHGNIDSLSCINKSIYASELDTWLNQIQSKEMAIIIEACHSGSFIGKYADGTYEPTEDDLTGAGKSKRVVFTSASTDTSSYADKDGADDPNASTDIGSESIYGYVEAFSITSADTNADGALSFEEGVQYAFDNDVTFIRGNNTPQFSSTADLDPARVHHYCYPVSDPNGPYSEACQTGNTEFMLDGSASEAPPPCDGTLTYAWDTDCPVASFNDPFIASPTLTLSQIGQCLECNVWLTVTCSDGSSETRLSTVTTTDSVKPTITCPPDITISCEVLPNPSITGVATSNDNCDLDPVITFSDSTTPGACPNAETITRNWTATDTCSNFSSCEQIIEVVDTTPPVIQNVAANPNDLWPPNHKMVQVTVATTATDNCDPSPACVISSVSSNEPINGLGDGNTTPDWVITGDLTVDIRAERSGNGDGRIYTIEVTCTDECGNSSTATAGVTVPHDKGK